MKKQTVAEMHSAAHKFGTDAGFVANLIATQHGRRSQKLTGLLKLLNAGHSVRTAQFSCDTLLIDGKQRGWELLESPMLIINGTW